MAACVPRVDGVPLTRQLVGPLTADEFSEVDFDTLEVYELRKRVHPVINLVQTFWEDPKELSRWV